MTGPLRLSPYCWRACPVITRREVWLPVPIKIVTRFGHRYEVSSLGRVRNASLGRLLTPYVHRTGYLAVSLGKSKRDETGRRVGGCFLVHTLVARAFIGPPPRDGYVYEVDHLDFDRTCAEVTDLRWLTKDTNAWRWKFWADADPEPEEPPPTREELETWNAMMRANGWSVPDPPKPHTFHRHKAAV